MRREEKGETVVPIACGKATAGDAPQLSGSTRTQWRCLNSRTSSVQWCTWGSYKKNYDLGKTLTLFVINDSMANALRWYSNDTWASLNLCLPVLTVIGRTHIIFDVTEPRWHFSVVTALSGQITSQPELGPRWKVISDRAGKSHAKQLKCNWPEKALWPTQPILSSYPAPSFDISWYHYRLQELTLSRGMYSYQQTTKQGRSTEGKQEAGQAALLEYDHHYTYPRFSISLRYRCSDTLLLCCLLSKCCRNSISSPAPTLHIEQ